MREIKFRGIPVFGNEFVYGYLNIYKNENGEVYQIIDNDNGVTRYDVKPETVGQFTGLKDKNEKEIYDGDIVKGRFLGDSGVIDLQGNIYFYQSAFGLDYTMEPYPEDKVFFMPLYDYFFGTPGIIGNIHENPELIK